MCFLTSIPYKFVMNWCFWITSGIVLACDADDASELLLKYLLALEKDLGMIDGQLMERSWEILNLVKSMFIIFIFA